MEIQIQAGLINAIWGHNSENSARVPIAYCVGCNPLKAFSAQLPRNTASPPRQAPPRASLEKSLVICYKCMLKVLISMRFLQTPFPEGSIFSKFHFASRN